MNFISRIFLTIALIFSTASLMAAEREEMHIRFVVAQADINKDYRGTEVVLDRMVEWAENIQKDSTVNIISVEFCGAVSPEGSVQFNHWLSMARLTALEKYVRSRVDIPEELITRSDHYIAWDELKEMILKELSAGIQRVTLLVPYDKSSVISRLHRDAKVISIEYVDEGNLVVADVDSENMYIFEDYVKVE